MPPRLRHPPRCVQSSAAPRRTRRWRCTSSCAPCPRRRRAALRGYAAPESDHVRGAQCGPALQTSPASAAESAAAKSPHLLQALGKYDVRGGPLARSGSIAPTVDEVIRSRLYVGDSRYEPHSPFRLPLPEERSKLLKPILPAGMPKTWRGVTCDEDELLYQLGVGRGQRDEQTAPARETDPHDRGRAHGFDHGPGIFDVLLEDMAR